MVKDRLLRWAITVMGRMSHGLTQEYGVCSKFPRLDDACVTNAEKSGPKVCATGDHSYRESVRNEGVALP